MQLTLEELLLTQIDNTKRTSKKQDIWIRGISTFYQIKELSIDERGRNGQEFLQTVFKCGGYKVRGDNEKTGDWDIKINNWRIEVKSACMDRQGKFQHENLHKTNNYDFVFFLDIAPDDIYFSCLKYKNIPFNILHERGNDSNKEKRVTGAGYKYDFKYKETDKKLPRYHGKVTKVQDIINIFKLCLQDN